MPSHPHDVAVDAIRAMMECLAATLSRRIRGELPPTGNSRQLSFGTPVRPWELGCCRESETIACSERAYELTSGSGRQPFGVLTTAFA